MRVYALEQFDRPDFEKNLSLKMRIIYNLGVSTGLRISDIVQLKKNILSIKEPTIKEQKTKKSKRFYIKSQLRNQLIEIAKQSKNDYIFYSNSKSGHISRQSVWKAFKIASLKCNINTNIGTQSMRKMYAQKIKVGHSYNYVKTKLNHDNISTAMLYCAKKEDF